MLVLLRLCQVAFLILYYRAILDWLRNDPDIRGAVKRYPRLSAAAFAVTIAWSVFIAALIAAFGANFLHSEYGQKVATPRLRMISLFYVFIVIPLFLALLYGSLGH